MTNTPIERDRIEAVQALFDGLVRFDVAHGINPNHALRADLYTSARF